MTDVVATNETILVVGGGVSGMTTALEAAEAGKQVILVEKRAYVGGRITQLYKYFPKLCFPTCGLEINQRRTKMNPNITILTLSEVESLTGEEGNYTATVKISPRYVNEKCTACGACADAVEAEFDDEYNYGLSKHKGAYLPHRMALPERYVIDPAMIGTDDAAKAKAACPVDAIDLDMADETVELKVGAVVYATGWRPYNANKIQPYGYDRYANVITSVEFERMNDPMGPTGGKILRPSDGKEAKDIAFIQCAGSRDRNYLKHCSRICCMASLKQTTYASDAGAKSTIYYIDIRAIDRFEDFYKNVQADENVSFIKSKVANITLGENDNPTLQGVDTEGYNRYATEHELVVLAVGMEPGLDASTLPGDVTVNEHGFIENDGTNGGIFAAGCASDALDVNRAVQSATACALKAIQVVNRVAGSEG
ncbi:Anaerobic respiratory complex protein QmoA [hydrothermal vent metagenome]|uniref:Anaerobic respiratory complex protein QmoA n=1 Tax=hydrothermal vent metagenome TaxID=652676 RepID=A0A3B0Y2Q0_9ZZZZ